MAGLLLPSTRQPAAPRWLARKALNMFSNQTVFLSLQDKLTLSNRESFVTCMSSSNGFDKSIPSVDGSWRPRATMSSSTVGGPALCSARILRISHSRYIGDEARRSSVSSSSINPANQGTLPYKIVTHTVCVTPHLVSDSHDPMFTVTATIVLVTGNARMSARITDNLLKEIMNRTSFTLWLQRLLLVVSHGEIRLTSSAAAIEPEDPGGRADTGARGA